MKTIPAAILILLCLLFLSTPGHAQPQWSSDPRVNNPVIAISGSDQTAPVIVRDGLGGAIVVWVDNRSGNADIFAKRIHASGELLWSQNGDTVAIGSATQESPTVVAGDDRNIFVAWQDNRNRMSQKEIFVQRFNIDGMPLWESDVRAHSRNNLPPTLIKNKSFGVITASYISGLFDDLIAFQILSNNGIPQLEPQGIVSESARGIQPEQPPAVVSGLDGGLIATWVDTRNPLPTIFARGIESDGETAWGAGDVPVGASVALDTYPVAVSDGREGAIIVWIATEATAHIVKAQRFNRNGNSLWQEGGVTISSISGNKRNLRIVTDDKSGAYVVWENLVGINWKLFALRIKSDRSTWQSGDVRISDSGGNQTDATLINDGRGEMIVVWEDNRANNLDIYAQKIDSSGVNKQWGQAGLAVSTNPNPQENPVLVDDGLGGAIIAWEDSRDPNSRDIYAQKVSAPGVLGEIRAIDITSPGGGETWEIGSIQQITWTWTGEISEVVVEYSRDGGTSWQEIVFQNGSRTNDGSGLWEVDVANSGEYLFRISDFNSRFISDVSAPFTISTQQGPEVQHTNFTQAAFGDSIPIAAVVDDISGVSEVILNYRKGGAPEFHALEMTSVAQDSFLQSIPPDSVTERGVEYFISSTDSLEQTTTSDTFFIKVTFESGVQTSTVDGGTAEDAYRMVSAPNLLNQTLADSILAASGFPSYDTTSWRLFKYRDGETVERDSANADSFTFEPGQAYWLISSRTRTIDFGSGVSLRTDSTVSITLEPGWNQIGIPYAFPVAWDTLISSIDTSMVGPLHFYREGGYDMADALQPFQGYFVFNRSQSDLNLTTPAVEFRGTDADTSLPRHNLVSSVLQIKAYCQKARDEFNFLGIKERASLYWDASDYPEPPPIGRYVSVYFPRNDWSIYPDNYTTDYRSLVGEGQTWTFDVRSNVANSEVVLNFSGAESFAEDIEIVLVDEALNVTRNLRAAPDYSFPTGNTGVFKSLKIVIGRKEYIARETASSGLIPTDFELSQNFPNPFNPTTAIRFGLPNAENVTIRIFDILGREVTTLVNGEQKEAGYHVVNWNGRDKNERPVASGLYIYQIRAGKFDQTRKMLLVK